MTTSRLDIRQIFAAPVALLYFGIGFCFFHYRQRRNDWGDFQTTRKNRYLSAVDGKVAWLGNGRGARPATISLAIGGGLGLITIVGALVGKENAQAAVAALSVVGLPILILGYGMRVIIGLSELRKLERTTGKRFPLPELDEAQRIRAANWVGRLVNPELRAIYRAERQDRKAATGRAYSRTRK